MACIFCQIVAGELPARVVFQDDHVTAFHDIHPVAPTHILVIPNRHVENLDALAEADADLAARLVLACRQVAEIAGVQGGYRVVTNIGRLGGQHVFHLHLHVLGGRQMGWPPI